MKVAVLADPDTARAREVFIKTGLDSEMIIETDKPEKAEDAVRGGKRVITADYTLAAKLEVIDIITDATPSPVRSYP